MVMSARVGVGLGVGGSLSGLSSHHQGMWHVVVPAFVVGFSILFHFVVSRVRPYCVRKRLQAVGRVLLVIAHPDDESMFFAPTIIQLCQQGCEVHLLCLSSGNFYNQGNKRKGELRQSCEILGIESSYVTIIEHTKLPDNPKSVWRDDLIATIILKYVSTLDINTIITFDQHGVSGHNNHIALYTGVHYLAREGLLPTECQVYVLETVNILRKYLGIFDIPLSYYTAKHAFVLPQKYVPLAQRAMCAHRSQMVWFRWLYIYCSRYMIINTYGLISSLPSEQRRVTRNSKLD